MDRIRKIALELKSPYIKNYCSDIVKEAADADLNHSEFLLMILEKEYELRQENSVKNR